MSLNIGTVLPISSADLCQMRFSMFWYIPNKLSIRVQWLLVKYQSSLVGLSKERPILDHHPKAYIHEIRRISPEIWRISGEIHPQPYKVRCFNKNSSVWGVHGGGYDPRFHEIRGHSPSPAFIKLDSFG